MTRYTAIPSDYEECVACEAECCGNCGPDECAVCMVSRGLDPETGIPLTEEGVRIEEARQKREADC